MLKIILFFVNILMLNKMDLICSSWCVIDPVRLAIKDFFVGWLDFAVSKLQIVMQSCVKTDESFSVVGFSTFKQFLATSRDSRDMKQI